MRRQLAVRLAALAVVLAAGVVSARAQTFTVGDIEYHVIGPNYDEEVEVIDYLGSGGHVTIPVSVFNNVLYRSYKVTGIRDGAFRGCTGLTSIDIPDGVTGIRSGAFSGCTGLTSVSFGDGLTSIGSSAFKGCTGLASIDIPDGVTSIEWFAFQGCTGLTSISFGNGLASIGKWAFEGCTGLASIDFPDGLASIGERAFEDCTGLTSVSFGNGLASIDYCAFSGCTGLTSVDFPDGLESIGTHAFWGCTGLTSISFGAGLESIGQYAFYGCTGLTSIDFPDGLASIGGAAFYGCTGLASIDIPDGVTSIGGSAFYGCTGLVSVSFGAGLESIEGNAFYGCTGLTSIDIPDGVTSIGDSAFYGCTGLVSVSFGAGLESIEGNAFYGCTGLTSIDFPADLNSIGESAFEDCTGLATVSFGAGLTSVGSSAFEGCYRLASIVSYATDCQVGDYAFLRVYLDCVVLLSNSLADSVGDLLDECEVFAFGDEPISVECGKLYTFLKKDEVDSSNHYELASLSVGGLSSLVYTGRSHELYVDGNTSSSVMELLDNETAVDAGTYTIDEVAFSFRYDEYGIDIPEVRIKLDEPLTYTINRAPQSISWDQDFTSGLLPGMTVELGAVSSSGLGVSYMSRDEGVVRIVESGGKPCAECVSEGACYIVAMQPGDRNHDAAPAVTKRVDVTRGSGLRGASGLSLGCRPSPALDVLEVTGTSEGMSCSAYDLSGALVLTSRCTDGATRLDVSRLAPGAYVLVVSDGGAAVSRLRFAKE